MRDFWSARRAAVREEEAAQARAAQAAEDSRAAEAEAARRAELTEAELCAEMGLPDPATLGPGDDFSAFMRDAVPARLRRAALRRLWGTKPVLANLDGMIDYGEDFTDAARCLPDLKTAYQVGRGLMRHVEAMAERAEALATPDEAQAEPTEAAPPAAPAAPAEVEIAAAEPPAAEAPDAGPPDAGPPAAGPRHMRFQFAG
jgi:hypothetical protein